MEIVFLKTPKEISFREDYSEFDKDDVISVLIRVCEQIDELQIARFELFFSKQDSRFSKLDFKYDFASVAVDWADILEIAKDGKGEEVLYFYELDRKVHFSSTNSYTLFKIFSDKDGVQIAEGRIPTTVLVSKVTTLLANFKKILQFFFPIAFKLFIEQDYLIS